MTGCRTFPRAAAYNPDAPRTGPGVYCLDDIKARCRIDPVTGCWHWAWGCTTSGVGAGIRMPAINVPPGVMGPKRMTITGARAAWLMSGRKLSAGMVVWRTCRHDDCVCPAHLRAGTKAEEGAWLAAQGVLRDDPVRRAMNIKACAAQAVPVETVSRIEALLAAGKSQWAIRKETGVNPSTISKIASGRHIHQRPVGARGSSVFHLGVA